jgi:voltage-gated potassium channel
MNYLHAAFHDDTTWSHQVLHRWINVLIALSVVVVLVDLSLPADHPAADLLAAVDAIVLGLFVVEYVLRVATFRPPELAFFHYSAVEQARVHGVGRLRFALTPFALVDLVTILAVVPALRGLRLLRLLRLIRTKTLFRYVDPFAGILRSFQENRFLYLGAYLLLAVGTVLGGGTGWLLERGVNPELQTLRDGLWWALVTLTTVGFGDIAPVTALGRILGGVLMVEGMFILALFAGIVGNTLLRAVLTIREEQFRVSNHIGHLIICGYDSGSRLLFDSLLEELDSGEIDILIFAPGERPAEIPPELGWVSGDPTKESELDKVRITHARAILLVGARTVSPQHADAATILTAFTMRRYLRRNEGGATRAAPLYIVGEILDSENVEHARAAGVDEVIESRRVGFSLLTHALAMPGTAEVLARVAAWRSPSLFVGELPSALAVPTAFGALSAHVKNETGALVIGVRSDGRDVLNPPDDLTVETGMHVLYLATQAQLPAVS